VDHRDASILGAATRAPLPGPAAAQALRRVAEAERDLDTLVGNVAAGDLGPEDVAVVEAVHEALQDALTLAER
jgi:hypothetical protein